MLGGGNPAPTPKSDDNYRKADVEAMPGMTVAGNPQPSNPQQCGCENDMGIGVLIGAVTVCAVHGIIFKFIKPQI